MKGLSIRLVRVPSRERIIRLVTLGCWFKSIRSQVMAMPEKCPP